MKLQLQAGKTGPAKQTVKSENSSAVSPKSTTPAADYFVPRSSLHDSSTGSNSTLTMPVHSMSPAVPNRLFAGSSAGLASWGLHGSSSSDSSGPSSPFSGDTLPIVWGVIGGAMGAIAAVGLGLLTLSRMRSARAEKNAASDLEQGTATNSVEMADRSVSVPSPQRPIAAHVR